MNEKNVIQQILESGLVTRNNKRILLSKLTSDLTPKEIFSLMRASVKLYTNHFLWEILLTKVFLLNHEEKESVKSNCCAFSGFKKKEFEEFKNIKQSTWEELVDKGAFNNDTIKSSRLNTIIELFKKVQNLNEKNYGKTFFNPQEIECFQLLLNEVGIEKLRLKLLNKPKEIFQKKIKALGESIKEIEGADKNEDLRKSITLFLVTGELKEGDKFLSDKKIFSQFFTQIYNIATEHNTVLSLKTLNLNFDLSTPENQGTYMAKWLLENLDFPFEREVNKKVKKSDKNLFSEMPGREKLNFQTKDKLHAIFPFYESEYGTLTTKEKLQEDQCSLMVLNLSNLRYYENNSMDTEHAASFKLIQEQLNSLLKYLNDENNTEFKEAFLGHKGVYGNNNKYQISDFFVEDEGQVKVTRLLCTLVYNNKNNLWLLSHGMNTQKSAKDTMDWLGSLGTFGEQCLEAIKKAGGVHDGPLLQWVYHADETLYFEIKLEVPAPKEEKNEKKEKKSKKKEPVKMVTVTKKFKMPAVINKETQERDTPKGLGQFIVEWFTKSDVGQIQTKLSKKMFEKISIPMRENLLELRAFSQKEDKEKFEQYQRKEKKIEKVANWLIETYESLEKAAENESQHSSESGASQGEHKESYASFRDETFSRLWHNYHYDKRIRKYIEIILEAFFPEGEEDWQQKRENAKKELLGEIKDAKFALLPKEQIKELKNYAKKEVMEKTMLENDEKVDFKTPRSKPKHKLQEAYTKGNKENVFSDFSKNFLSRAKTKEQRLEEENKILKEKDKENEEKLREKEEENKKLREEIERLKRERELPSSKEKEIEHDDKRPKTDDKKEESETRYSFSSVISNSTVIREEKMEDEKKEEQKPGSGPGFGKDN